MNSDQKSYSSKWIDLFQKIDVIGKPWTSSIHELDEFESISNLILPQEFKDFCQTFGSGVFGNSEVYFDCPHDDNQELIESELEIRETLMLDLKEEEENYTFLKSAYIFGYGVGDTSIWWDLRTYEDQSYEIYIYNEWEKKKYRFGRSFFDFVVDVCIERRVFKENLLEHSLSDNDIFKQRSFVCFGQTTEGAVST